MGLQFDPEGLAAESSLWFFSSPGLTETPRGEDLHSRQCPFHVLGNRSFTPCMENVLCSPGRHPLLGMTFLLKPKTLKWRPHV